MTEGNSDDDPNGRSDRGTGRVTDQPPRRLSSVALRLAGLLTLALLPLGLLAFEQTRRLEAELEQVRALNLHAVTAEIARREAADIARAAGLARGLSTVLPILEDTSLAACSDAAREVVARSSGRLVFVGFTAPDGIMDCTSTGGIGDFSQMPEIMRRMTEEQDFVTTSTSGRMSQQPVIAVHEPARDASGAFAGFATVSLAAREVTMPEGAGVTGMNIALVNADGEMIGSTGDAARVAGMLPADDGVTALAERSRSLAEDREGREREYFVEPILPGVAYAVGMLDDRPQASGSLRLPSGLVPLLMWVASVALVLGVLERSLMGPVRSIGRHMRRFGDTRRLPQRAAVARALPSELAAIEETFVDVASQLRRDEERLIDALAEQKALLREVHHRVKNNLQIISSIINLQVRNARSPETEDALSRISTRIASLAAVHRRLYESDSVRRMRFDMLLQEVLATLIDSARIAPDTPAGRAAPPNIETTFDLIPLQLSPDQGLSAAMFSVEAVTNALKYARPDETGRRWLLIRLFSDADGLVTLSIENSGAPPQDAEVETNRSTLGHRLIAGFARQLHGTQEIGWRSDRYVVAATFRPRETEPAAEPPAAPPDERAS